MKNSELLKTIVGVNLILLFGFSAAVILSYQTNYQESLDKIEEVSSLATDGIFYQLITRFAEPVNVSLSMAHDSFLKERLLEEAENQADGEYAKEISYYLNTYQKNWGFDSVFLVSADTLRYYNFNGIDRILTPDDTWYYNLLEEDEEYSLNIDSDRVAGADRAVTVFVNCKIRNEKGFLLGVVGVGFRVDYLEDVLRRYEQEFNVKAILLDENGFVKVSSDDRDYELKDWFKTFSIEGTREDVLGWKKENDNLKIWASQGQEIKEKIYVVTRYIPEIGWHLIVEQETGHALLSIRNHLYMTWFLMVTVISGVFLSTAVLIRKFRKQIAKLIEERQNAFIKATEQLYDKICEVNISKNCVVGKQAEGYFESLGMKDSPYTEGLRMAAEKEIREEFREGYLSTFAPDNVLREYEKGNQRLHYEFQTTEDGTHYVWMRIEAYIFYLEEDDSIHMYAYRKNIEKEKERELQARTDEMTRFFSKKETERLIKSELAENGNAIHAFFIMDIDNFKQANDCYGHVFGDYCIKEFTEGIRKQFRENDILGRIGGDEFVAFIPISDIQGARKKAEELTLILNTHIEFQNVQWKISASIGVAIYPIDGGCFEELYRNADKALYYTKRNGKSGFTLYQEADKVDDT